MEKVRLGRTNIKVSRVGIGGIPIQRPSTKEAIAVIQHALDNGISLIDTSIGYMYGKVVKTTDNLIHIEFRNRYDEIDEIQIWNKKTGKPIKAFNVYHKDNEPYNFNKGEING